MDAGALFGALWARALRIVIVTLLLVAATFVILLFVPKLYESSSSVLVEDRSSVYTEATGTGTTSGGGSGITIDALLSSQIELIKSRDTLLAVINTLNLTSVPEFNGSAGSPFTAILSLIGRKPEPKSIDETVLQNLNDRLTVIRERDSAVISIFVRSADPQLAATIANAIAAEHVKRRAGQSAADTAEAAQSLLKQIEALRATVKKADAAVANYRAKNGIFAGSNGTTLPDQQISDIGRQITDAQGRKNAAEQTANLIRSLIKAGQAVDGIEDVRNSPSVQTLVQQRATLQSQLAEKLATLLPAHPTIIALNAQIAQVNAQIKSEARRVADGLTAQVGVEDGVIKSLNDDLARAQLAASDQTKDSVTLDSLTREAKAQRDLLDTYLLKYRDAASRTDTGGVLPDVRIITQAAPSVVPASPKTALILGAVAFVGLALQIGMVLFGELTSGRAVYDRNLHILDEEHEAGLENAVAAAVDERQAEIDEQEAAEPDLFDVPEPILAEADEPVEDDTMPVQQPRPEPPPLPAIEPAARHIAAAATALDMSNLAADIALGRARILLLAGVSEGRDAAVIADRLVADALSKGLSVCRVDAGSGRASQAPGLSDLCADQASFGDVVHKVREGLAEVPWGHLASLERRSTKPLTLVEALGDIYEVVIVSTGRIGLNSSLQLFSGIAARLVLVRQDTTPQSLLEAVTADAETLGFELVQSIRVPERESEVA